MFRGRSSPILGVALPAVALVLVSIVLGIQLAYGGGSDEPLGPVTRPDLTIDRSRGTCGQR